MHLNNTNIILVISINPLLVEVLAIKKATKSGLLNLLDK